ncbi:MAG: hypothetical protein CVV23_15695 [Ignavibacteriae bacterium HGW-Ignavibacteriae-2]|jgi:uncharacterized damage-inducible protein DinB|nr:DinB family protein [Bacteroidota bacterium]PKL87364.1 MAG: hypothetical protein CVV23_15695 [Ignavibacteriae bacterium HGW-Ignavibacteriae-2]
MYKSMEDFLQDWKMETEFTLSVFSGIGDENVTAKVSENTRSLGRLAWHITQTLTEMPHKAGFIDEDYLDGKPLPENFSEIKELYKKYNEALVNNLSGNFLELDLTKTVELYGENWEYGKVLSALVKHQIHHRAQMTVVMRLKNIPVPGVYGPSKEEWGKYGMSPQE